MAKKSLKPRTPLTEALHNRIVECHRRYLGGEIDRLSYALIHQALNAAYGPKYPDGRDGPHEVACLLTNLAYRLMHIDEIVEEETA